MKNIKLHNRQKGVTLMGGIIIALIGGFFAYLALLIFPVIISNHTMGNVLSSLSNEPGITQKSKSEIMTMINKRLRINDVKDVKTDHFEFVRENDNETIIYLDYDNKIYFAKDIFILIENHKEVVLTRN